MVKKSDEAGLDETPAGTKNPEKLPEEQRPAPATTAGKPARPPDEVVITEDYVKDLAKNSLPDDEALQDFISWSISQLPDLTRQVLASGPFDTNGNWDQFTNEVARWSNYIDGAEKELDKKDVPSPTPSAPTSWPPVPGIASDELCKSIFDINDLALKGRKSVLAKKFYMPAIFPQFRLDALQKWKFGQKMEYRQEWRHEGYTLGELISSLSLLPNEELTMEVSSWQKTKKEIAEEEQTDTKNVLESQLRNTDEQTTTNEAASSNGWTVSATGSVSYGPASASVSASATGNTDERSSQTETHITDATTKATNEISLKRAIKMTQSIESGSEQRTVRRIKNPNTCHTVTYTFFQVIKLYDVQLRLENDAPTVMLPGIFPSHYTPKTADEVPKPVQIPYYAIESFTSPAVFLTQFFEVDRDISQEIWGWGLRVRMDIIKSPAAAIIHLTQALLVAVKYLLKLDPAIHTGNIANLVGNYAITAMRIRQRAITTYGKGMGASQQISTPGIYADSVLGRCSACEEYIEASRYQDIMRQNEEKKSIEINNGMNEQELKRRKELIKNGTLDPFDKAEG